MDKSLKTALIVGGIILGILLIVPTIVGAFTGWGGGSYGWGMMGPGMMGSYGGYGIMGLMGLFWIVVVGLIIWAVVAASHGMGHGSGTEFHAHSDSALEILKHRYAKGEINKAEYEEKKKDLS